MNRTELIERWYRIEVHWETHWETYAIKPTMPAFLDQEFYNINVDKTKNDNETSKKDNEDDNDFSNVSKKSLFTLTYCLKHILLNGIINDQGDEIRPLFNSQNELADHVEDKFSFLKGSGISTRTIKAIFAKANEITGN